MNFKVIKSVFEISENFLKDSKYVKVNEAILFELSNVMKESPVTIRFLNPPNLEGEIIRDILKNSINYCYWYGRSDIRPNNSCASKLGNIVDTCFTDSYNYEKAVDLSSSYTKFLCKITEERFPLIEERTKHLKQVLPYVKQATKHLMIGDNLEKHFLEIICLFPGYGSDIFLKRACLLFIELYRKYEHFRNLYKDGMKNFPVAADYQVPKILEHFSCISYSPELKRTIETNQLIQKHSIQECEIRSATILSCQRLCDLTGWTVAEVDWWLWSQRDSVKTPFHLCVTTDY